MISTALLSLSALLPVVALTLAAAMILLLPRIPAHRIATGAVVIAVGATAFSAFMYTVAGPVVSPPIGENWLALSSRVDPLNILSLGVVVFVGLIVTRFSRDYLDGNPRKHVFFGWLCLTLASVSLLVTSGTLAQLLIGWIGTSLSLHRLLLFYPERKLAVVAARKKFWLARSGDACLLAAAWLLWQTTGSVDIAAINQWFSENPATATTTPALLLGIAALLKCAQFPTHGWLTEVMETPTPVSALLHAGIVNGGGYLLIRFADVVIVSEGALLLLICVGGASALIASLCMLTQTSIKRSLAYSTVAQMGFMMLQCGLGAFSSAALHLVAHSVYKAYGFLNSGNTVAEVRQNRMATQHAEPPRSMHVAIALGMALAIYAILAALFSHIDSYPVGVLALGAIFVLGLTGFLARSLQGGKAGLPAVGRAVLATTVYFGLQSAMLALFANQLPVTPFPGAAATAITCLVIAGFASIVWLQFAISRRPGKRLGRLYLALRNGLYINHLTNRFTGVYRRES